MMKRITQFANSAPVGEDLEHLSTLIVINYAIRNGTAHLKNLDLVYDDVQGKARLAPVHDLVTTSVYLPKDCMAGSTNWLTAKELQRLGETRMGRSPAHSREILQRVTHAMEAVAMQIRPYLNDHPESEEVGNRMLVQWEQGIATSLRR